MLKYLRFLLPASVSFFYGIFSHLFQILSLTELNDLSEDSKISASTPEGKKSES